ncbi:hypothetical protein [Nitratireductor sp. XY-223]|uniref:hypothetical protein n=1 Tax=Nitratireductor sp. XY-223 TaxID=2561926 RepID=UPI0010AAB4F2|nr:hypothetical protein [Nitratireductor sp. XY-223]
MKDISTEQALKQAMERLLAGRADRTDGRLTIANLAREAGVSRATAYRCSDIVEAFRCEVKARNGRKPGTAAHRSKITALGAELDSLRASARKERRAHETTINAMAQRIQALTLLTAEQERQIADLHEALFQSGVVTPLRARKSD